MKPLLERLDEALYRAEGLTRAADVVAHDLLDFARERLGCAAAEGASLEFLLEEAKRSATEARDRFDDLAAAAREAA